MDGNADPPGLAPYQADQAWPEPPQQSRSVTKLAATGQLLMAASGQVPMTANKRRQSIARRSTGRASGGPAMVTSVPLAV
jgi:hypothetical protein